MQTPAANLASVRHRGPRFGTVGRASPQFVMGVGNPGEYHMWAMASPMNPLSPRRAGWEVPTAPRPIAAPTGHESRVTASGISNARRSVNSLTTYPGTAIRVAHEKIQNDMVDADTDEKQAEEIAQVKMPPAGMRTPRMVQRHDMVSADLQSLKAREQGGLGAKLCF